MRNYETRHQTRKIPFPNEDFKTVIAVSSVRFHPKSQKANAICTEGFFTPDSFHSTSLATWGSSWASTEAKFIKEFEFLSFSCCFSARIEKSLKTSKI